MNGTYARKVRSRQTLERAWRAIQSNASASKSEQTKNEIADFATASRTHLDRIYRQLQTGKFVFPPAKGIKVPKDKKDKTKFRPLVVAKIESRIVQRAIHDVLLTIPAIEAFIKTPHSFGGIRKAKKDDVTAVPAAVQEVLATIGNGAKFLVKSDIQSFFTKISKPAVTAIVAGAVPDEEFLQLFTKAITVELENMAQLKSAAAAFPTSDIGVAQGNSLSPLLGNIILHDFDHALNTKKGIRCVRYIDDFIILGPTKDAVSNAFAKALHILKKHDMYVSPGKTKHARTDEVFNFLGIEFAKGLFRPGAGSQARMLASIGKAFSDSEKAFRDYRKGDTLDHTMSLLQTLSRVRGITHGWAKHYKFCNDGNCFQNLDAKVSQRLKQYLSIYGEERDAVAEAKQWNILGVEAIASIERKPLIWPTAKKVSATSIAPTVAETDPDPAASPW